jgi:predicted ATPase
MYLRQLTLQNFRGFESLEWSLPAGSEAGWHVLLGPNGSGKSTFLRAAAIAFTGPAEFMAARRPTQDFIRRADDVHEATIDLSVSHEPTWDKWAGKERQSNQPVNVAMMLHRSGSLSATCDQSLMERTLWGEGLGWFSAAFGPMRRFTGGNPESLRLFASYRRLARHLSVFGEDVALTEALEWLRQLRFKQLERADPASTRDLLDRVRDFVNQPGFLPYGAQLADVSSDAINFVDGNGVQLPVVELSDGYRAVLSMTFELVRLMADRFGEGRVFSDDSTSIVPPGVVLIDEIDAHLHPSWQREIGPWLTRLFPNVQFIVTTHSPYVCQAAQKGSVWTLPAPGSSEPMHRIEGEQLTRVLYGDVLHVLNSEAFGGLPGRSDEALQALDRLAGLNRRLDHGTLSAAEGQERQALEDKLAPVIGGDDA